MDKLGAKLQAMLRSGADPRRADSHFNKREDGVSTAAHVRTLAATGTASLMVGVLVGVMVSLTGIVTAALILDLRPARMSDIRLSQDMRAALPHPEALSRNDIISRLAIPADVGRLLAPMAALDPRMEAAEASWIASVAGQVPLVLDPGRTEALSELTTRMALSKKPDRIKMLDTILEMARALQAPGARSVLQAIATLPKDSLAALNEPRELHNFLEEIAALNQKQRASLLIAHLPALIPDDPERVTILRDLPDLDITAVRVVKRWSSVNNSQRQMLIYMMDRIENSDPAFIKIITAFYVGNRQLESALRRINPSCGAVNIEACR